MAVLLLAIVMVSAQVSTESWLRTLVPVLEDVRKSIGPRLTAAPGSLPPSPITGHSAALFAIRIGVDSVDVDERVVKAMDRLIAWRKDPKPLSSDDEAIVDRWVEALHVKVAGRLLAKGVATSFCDDLCVAGYVRNADTLFDGTPRQRRDEQHRMLLDTLTEAVLAPPERTHELHWEFARP
jgi:hypothetical protein